MDTEQKRRERAYKIWEDEGRLDGAHDDHWNRAGDQHETTEEESEEVTKVNQVADDKFASDNSTSNSSGDLRPPSTVSPD